jgi:hypothetical protein
MDNFLKLICSLFLFVAVIATEFAWFDHQPGQITWIVRIAGPIVAVLSLAAILKLYFRHDIARDYLMESMGEYFNRNGFCFKFDIEVFGGVCQFHTYFQNQYEGPCVGRIVLRPARGFFLTCAKIDTITLEIPCEAAGYGVATLPIPLPREVQGKKQVFEVGASVNYPQGKGRRLRFRDGVYLRTNSNFGITFGEALTISSVLGMALTFIFALRGTFLLLKPETIEIPMPTNAAEELPDRLSPRIIMLWKLGDLPIDI